MVIKEIEVGKRGVVSVVVESVCLATAKNGNEFQKLIVKDTEGTKINCINFGKLVDENSIVDAIIECGEYNKETTYQLKDYEVNKELNSLDFLPKSKVDVNGAWKNIISYIKSINNEKLGKLVCKVLSEELKVFKIAPLTSSDAYARTSGLIEATHKLMEAVDAISVIMDLDRDIMMAAASVYYIGAIDMVNDEYLPTIDTVLIGCDIATHNKLLFANSRLGEDAIDEETFKILDNIILSRYLGKPTATPEAFTLKMLDSIVTVVDMGESILNNLNPGSFVKENTLRNWYKKTSELVNEEVA